VANIPRAAKAQVKVSSRNLESRPAHHQQFHLKPCLAVSHSTQT
jgi:hypothetical protein